MAKRMTLRKQKFSLSDIPVRKLKTDAKVSKVSSVARLKDQELVFRAFWQCLVEQDLDSFKDILRGHMEAVNKQQLAKRSKTSRRTLHRALSPDGNPTLKNISSIIHALYG